MLNFIGLATIPEFFKSVTLHSAPRLDGLYALRLLALIHGSV